MPSRSIISAINLLLLSIVIGIIVAIPLIIVFGEGVLGLGGKVLRLYSLLMKTGSIAAARALLFWGWMGTVVVTSLIISILLYLVFKILRR
ncbi:MAG: hypothetical protein N3F04_02855 [Candidatus Nezhaarchaeota archaeon]|nr:hypothetical protein [Candidatus Nezhaarchaeota archaeon]MCX8141709.1 hypothetical protein [Candidatus Nezhaarchaeota archaeon]MDW8049976.1 hypothetical protein [Nitrososphaerota archaeon]